MYSLLAVHGYPNLTADALTLSVFLRRENCETHRQLVSMATQLAIGWHNGRTEVPELLIGGQAIFASERRLG